MDFIFFYNKMLQEQSIKNRGLLTLYGLVESQNMCKFKLKSSHTGADFYGEIWSLPDGTLQVSAVNKRSSENKGKFIISTFKNSSVSVLFSEIYNFSKPEAYNMLYKMAVYCKREYKKNFK